jgi:HEAT repeat protein
MKRLLGLTVIAVLWSCPAYAYVDGSPTLGSVIRDSSNIVVLEVTKVNAEKRVIVYKKVADLKGQHPTDEVRHAIGEGSHPREPRTVLDLAKPGAVAICFHNGKVAQTCLGKYWYESVAASEAPWWSMTYGRSELSLAYFGSTTKLRGQLTEILAGKTAVITAVMHASNDYWAHGDVLNKKVLGGKASPVWRIRASLNMPGMSYQLGRDPKQNVVGFGAGSAEHVPGLVQALKGADQNARLEAAQDLGWIGKNAKSAVPALLEASRAPGALVRVAAAESLVRIDPAHQQAGVNSLVASLKDERKEVRRAAAEALGRLGAEAKPTLPALVEALKDADADVRWMAADALGQIGAEAKTAVPALVEALKDPAVRSIAIDALGGIGADAKDAAGPLAELLKNENIHLRRTTAMALARIGGPAARPAVPVFVEMLRGDARLRWDALLFLSSMGKEAKEAIPVLNELVKGGDGIACYALVAAAGSEATAAIPLLINNISGGEWDSSDTLIEIGPAVVEPLLAATKDMGNWKSKDWSGKILAGIAGKDNKVIPRVIEAVKSPHVNTRYIAAAALSRLGPKAKAALPALNETLKDSDLWVRLYACWAILAIAPAESKAVIPVLAKEIHNGEYWARRSSVQAVASVGRPASELIPAVTEKLKDGDAGVRVAAAWALVQLGGLEAKNALPVLSAGLKDPDSWTRQTAATYLGSLGAPGKQALPALKELANDENEDVRKAAAEAVKQLDK